MAGLSLIGEAELLARTPSAIATYYPFILDFPKLECRGSSSSRASCSEPRAESGGVPGFWACVPYLPGRAELS